jgi:hypothetical protein
MAYIITYVSVLRIHIAFVAVCIMHEYFSSKPFHLGLIGVHYPACTCSSSVVVRMLRFYLLMQRLFFYQQSMLPNSVHVILQGSGIVL